MTIKARLQIATIIAIGLSFIVGFSFFFAAQQLDEIIEENRIANEIVKGVFGLNILTNDHLLHPNERTRDQWWSRYNSTSRLLIEAERPRSLEKQQLVENLRENHKRIARTFFQLVTVLGRRGKESTETSQALEERLVSQLSVRSQAMVSNAFILARLSRQELTEQQQQLNLFVVVAILILVLVIVISFLWTMASTLKPIRVLQEGTKIIGTGNLDYKIGTSRKDEIGELSNAFNEMTDKLKRVTASRDELDKEVAERKRAETEINAKNRELETLLYVTSHDLREPLRSIENFSRMVNERYADRIDEKGQDFLARVVRAAERMSLLLDDILTLSRAQRMERATDRVKGEGIVREALRRLEGRIDETSAKVRVGNDLPRLLADRMWATEAVYNLIANALKFTRDAQAPQVEIAGYQGDGEVGIVVRDRGPGVMPEHAERIFQLFQRAVAREVEGTGAGLAIVRQVAERHGGRAWVQPREGGGSEFIITFGRSETFERG